MYMSIYIYICYGDELTRMILYCNTYYILYINYNILYIKYIKINYIVYEFIIV